jgi:hypothetical protein
VSNTFAHNDGCALRVIVEVNAWLCRVLRELVLKLQHQKSKEVEAQR